MTPYEFALHYMLNCVSEEAAEVVQEMAKIARFGAHDICPVSNTANIDKLVNEINDLHAVTLITGQLANTKVENCSAPQRIATIAAKLIRTCDVSIEALVGGRHPYLGEMAADVQMIVGLASMLFGNTVLDDARIARKKDRIVEYLTYSVERGTITQEVADLIKAAAHA